MKNKILVVGVAFLSIAAVAQSNGNGEKKEKPATSSEVTSPRDVATGQATGKRMHKPITVTAEVGLDASSKDAAKDKPTTKSAQDDWQTPSAKTSGTPKVRPVATGDVDGDRAAHAATVQNSAASSSDVKSPRDVATGQASGKRTQAPAAATKEQKSGDAAPKK